jgi:hypothetical protein
LINNYCINQIFIEKEGGDNTGEIHFVGGEIYLGEIVNDLPVGFGTLKMNDGSYYEGQFDGKCMTEGFFMHFTGTKMEGVFSRDRIQKGKIYFTDGDVFDGEWNMKRSKWTISRGILKDSDNKVLFKFRGNDNESFKSQLKTIHIFYDDYGFAIEFEHFFKDLNEILNSLILTSECNCYYEKKNPVIKSNSLHSLRIYTQIPYFKQEYFENGKVIKKIYNICFGLTLETFCLKNDSFKLTFDDVKKIHAIGYFDMQRIKFSFNGNLFYNSDSELGKISIKKTSFGKLLIVYKNERFDDLKKFKDFLATEKPLELIEAKRTLSTSSESLPIMNDIINDIKQHENCIIF